MSTTRRGLLALAALAPGVARAQPAFPSRQVSVVVGVAPGGTADMAARILAAEYPRHFGDRYPFVVENRPGAATQIGTAHVARQPADGHTLLVAGAPFAINPGLFPQLPYDTARDFAPVTLLVRNGLFLVVPAAHPARDLPGFLAFARERGGANVASAGNASMSHMALELLASRTGAPLTHVPFRGSGLAMPALLGGQVDAMFENPSTALPQVREGRLRAIAFSGAERSPAAPEVPTVAEAAGLPGYLAVNFFGLWARAGTPEPLLDRLHAATVEILGRADVVERFARDGVETSPMARDAFGLFVAEQMRVWAEVVRERGIQPG
ncbi:Bug family tripartite tricarboxylate transporter substrate binding protein [Falsiroseomonas oryziterrae]|uniref:Bug family tripartite tricarboxylate transporter substrate binding protein n=1 Tax=Falsiroseomonas oryziterrae TaxID=2911368 RepID=UPI001F3ADD81|nr:tripartite tricarboxylate transporter substrate-binding protein [Roseomonas sp. NPKOSM-4]